MDKLFVRFHGEWKAAYEWPLPETRWTEFYLHKDGLLSEHEIFPDEMASTFKDTPEDHSSLTFVTPPMVENAEVCGPMMLNLYASITDTKVLWFVNLIDPAGNERVLTRGWLRGSQRRIAPEKSRPWQPYHPHDRREPIKAPGW